MTGDRPGASDRDRYGAIADGRTDALATLAPGTRIGKYQVLEVLGQGGFGITYRALDTQLDREIALKEYLPSYFAARQSDLVVLPRSTKLAEDFLWGRERFLAEAKTLARLTGAPGVVDVFDFLEANGTAYMVMALVQGETLETLLKRDGRLPQAMIARLLPPLLDGLERVHRAGFLHRDIKPANILIDAEGVPTLIDFGASRVALQGRTQTMTAVYTTGYAAFEQMTSARQGPWTDIYALAGTLYHCVSGAPPPGALDRMADERLVPAIEAGKGRYAPNLLAAIDAGLALKATDRPQSIADWRALLSGRPALTPARPGELETRRMSASPAGPARRRPAWVVPAAVAAAITLCLSGGGVYVMMEQRARAEAEAHRQQEERARQETAARQKAEAEARARTEAAAAAKAEAARREQEGARRAAEEKARAEAAARRVSGLYRDISSNRLCRVAWNIQEDGGRISGTHVVTCGRDGTSPPETSPLSGTRTGDTLRLTVSSSAGPASFELTVIDSNTIRTPNQVYRRQ